MQRRAAAFYAGFFILAVLVGYVAMAAAEPAPVTDDTAQTLSVGENVTINGQQYTLSDISATPTEAGNVRRAAEFTHTGTGETVSFADSEVVPMYVVQGGVPTSVAYTPSPGTIPLGGEEFGAYYPNNNTVNLMTKDVHSRELSSLRTLQQRFQGVWAVVWMGLIAAVGILCISYLPRRG